MPRARTFEMEILNKTSSSTVNKTSILTVTLISNEILPAWDAVP